MARFAVAILLGILIGRTVLIGKYHRQCRNDRRGQMTAIVLGQPIARNRNLGRHEVSLVAFGGYIKAIRESHFPILVGLQIDRFRGDLDAVDRQRYLDICAGLTPLVPLVDSEPTTALQRLAMVVDCANGTGAVLDPARFVFMNTDTVVHLHRLPVGHDFGLRARASIGPDGVGVTTAEIFDRSGFIGTCAQTLLVQRQ